MNINEFLKQTTNRSINPASIFQFMNATGVSYFEFCNQLACYAASQLLRGAMDFTSCNNIMYCLLGFMSDDKYWPQDSEIVEPAYTIICIIEEGEYVHGGDDRSVNPVEKYVLPLLQKLFRGETEIKNKYLIGNMFFAGP